MSIELSVEDARKAATYLRSLADLSPLTASGREVALSLTEIADLLDPRLRLYDAAIAAFEEAFEGEGRTLGSALDHMLTVLADRVEKFPEIETYATPRALLCEISDSLRPGEEEDMIQP